ncbi:double-strand break repair helicase AddA [Paramagnetospirillum kuznetsovii]|uniref:DNA 3'-5' helicase n=1 Tax=Paramagnetospirillum kuznetsovii TaxID=2053833 RepID=A0A364P159_9PROT|nr:double-strand break repair helicase AddA [Paramagnetospirillum kuznetsovii]RAU22855.1 double-strand break repair helicase AddA [Paramagnetospirillum kuznetsovii]
MTSPVLAQDADSRQRRAADPAASVWVAASAGTGKTKVLTDRVLTLLLAGTPPHKILCLTFTKAAAAEMSNRIQGRLARWATSADEKLVKELSDLLGRAPTDDEPVRARRLFAQVLDAPGGMHMETIHAFCQSLLRRFPLEAGIAPHFQVMDERDAAELLEAAKLDVLALARDGADGELARALALVTGRVHETAFPDLMAELASERGRLERLLDRHGGTRGVVAAFRARLGLEPGETAAHILARACDDTRFDAIGLRAAASALLGGAKTDQERGTAMASWLADPAGRAEGFTRWRLVFLTQAGEIRKTLCTKAIREGFPGVEDALACEAERLVMVADRLKAAAVAEATEALLILGAALLASYKRAKALRALMDYDDLILAARDLLARPGVAPWVLFKLDGGIDHVLIDEAQDTNPDQWAVAAALTEEFFAGRGAREVVRTVFAVGDAKQSIYSFQRADPREFERMRQSFARHVPESGGQWDEVALNLSFRSTQAVLDAVNAVFAPGQPGRDGVAPEGDDITHLAHRRGFAGRVEVWPPLLPRAADEAPAWKPPVERIRGDSPRARLARLVARRIKAMIESERLESKNRPVRAGDVLVLVRRRGGFVEDLVRELKACKVEVAGSDRMVLADQMAVMDLVALGNFLLLPDDDLTLATVLKGPLVGLSEEQLFALAHGRGEARLWETLKRRILDDADFEIAYTGLAELLGQADHLSPHALYARVLGPLGGRRRLLARLGMEAEDPIDEFMALTLAFERAHPPSLQGFLHWLEAGDIEIKRDLEQAGRDAVRIMTVHGSKGLQAPIVILPDTMQVPTRASKLLWLGEGDEELLSWPPRAEDMDCVCRDGAEARKLATQREYRRLLYVAMTRAEDRLVVCGWQGQKAPPEGCWHRLISDALKPLAAEVEDAFLAREGETDGAGILLLSCPQSVAVDAAKVGDTARPIVLLPDWATHAAEAEPSPPRPLAPSRPDGEEPPVRSPLAEADGGQRWQRGKLIHRLLQTVPDLPAPDRATAMMRFLNRPGWGLETKDQLAIANEVSDIVDHPGLAGLFGPGAKAEVPLVGRIGDRVVSGRVDRLAVTATEVLVVDYKTNRRPPVSADEIPDLYVRQMAAYRLALACIYPRHRIRCLLVWTDGPRLMEIEAARLDDALAGLVDD